MTRKNKLDWLQAGLSILAQAGLSGLTIDAMSLELGLTKGSFYHHFENLQDFQSQLLDYWADQYFSTSDTLPDSSQERLALLDMIIEEIFSPITEPEVAIRLWGQQDDQARARIEQVDSFRRRIVYEIFHSLVDDKEKAGLMADLLFTMTIGSMTALPRIPTKRVGELYQEFKQLYQL